MAILMLAMIIPGNGNSLMSEIWYPYVKRELEKLGFRVIAKEMPDPDIAHEKYWIPFIEKQIIENRRDKAEEVILIGHSSGAVAILRYLESHKVTGAVLIGACYTDLGDSKERESGYYSRPWNWNKIKQNFEWITVFASTDDDFIPIDEPKHIRDKLQADYFEFNDRGHFMDEEFPEILEVVRTRMKK